MKMFLGFLVVLFTLVLIFFPLIILGFVTYYFDEKYEGDLRKVKYWDESKGQRVLYVLYNFVYNAEIEQLMVGWVIFGVILLVSWGVGALLF